MTSHYRTNAIWASEHPVKKIKGPTCHVTSELVCQQSFFRHSRVVSLTGSFALNSARDEATVVS
jgi:uncharacterized membrane protein